MNATEIINAIESETLDIHCYAYSDSREFLDESLPEELENGDVVGFAKNAIAAYRRAMLHSLQAIDAPDSVIESIFNTP